MLQSITDFAFIRPDCLSPMLIENFLKVYQLFVQHKNDEILTDIKDTIANGPSLAMVNSDKGITNLHIPRIFF